MDNFLSLFFFKFNHLNILSCLIWRERVTSLMQNLRVLYQKLSKVKTLRKGFYCKETILSIRISPYRLKSLNFIMIDRHPWSKKRVNYLSCMERKGVWQTFSVFRNSRRKRIFYHYDSIGTYIFFFKCRLYISKQLQNT